MVLLNRKVKTTASKAMTQEDRQPLLKAPESALPLPPWLPIIGPRLRRHLRLAATAVLLLGFLATTFLYKSSTLSGVLETITSQSTTGERIPMNKEIREQIAQRTHVVTTTYYPDTTDIRFQLALDLCNLAFHYKIHTFIVDDSPNFQDISDQFTRAGGGYVHVFQQNKNAAGGSYVGKGGALRQAIARVTKRIKHTAGLSFEETTIIFTEPEKVDLMNHLFDISKPILDGETDVVVPMRNDDLFRETYPIEQYHSESFGNLHFDLMAKQFPGFQREGAQKLDWLFGPFAFRANLASGWLNYHGTAWDAQMVPYVRGVRNDNWRIMSVIINFHHKEVMKRQEEGTAAWTKKRLMQLNLLFELLGDEELVERTES
mmetsp:Transcript_27552/g.58216  ORF Transcript_27552/g.58216 Transcript_27552/m.58216 type:complete len:374 (+) Transcript_27552:3-1124(+)